MPLVLVRVDDRLIHGQVVEGWLPLIQARRILVVNDHAAADDLEQSLMRMAVPEDVEVEVVAVGAAARTIARMAEGPERVMVLLAGVEELMRVVEAGAPIGEVNVGGIHDGPGRVMRLPHLSLTAREAEILTALCERGLAVDTRSLPMDPVRSWRDLTC